MSLSVTSALLNHMAAKPYYTLSHDMDSLYSIIVTAYSADCTEEWQATISTEEARRLIAGAERLHDSEGYAMEAAEFAGLLQRLDKEWLEMCQP